MSDLLLRLDWKTARKQADPDLLEQEIQAERASALGGAGRKLERALADLSASDTENRAQSLDRAARIAWEFMVMRESSGLRDWPRVIRIYQIPADVQKRMGVAPPRPEPD